MIPNGTPYTTMPPSLCISGMARVSRCFLNFVFAFSLLLIYHCKSQEVETGKGIPAVSSA